VHIFHVLQRASGSRNHFGARADTAFLEMPRVAWAIVGREVSEALNRGTNEGLLR
jgi:hypothetical protein